MLVPCSVQKKLASGFRIQIQILAEFGYNEFGSETAKIYPT